MLVNWFMFGYLFVQLLNSVYCNLCGFLSSQFTVDMHFIAESRKAESHDMPLRMEKASMQPSPGKFWNK